MEKQLKMVRNADVNEKLIGRKVLFKAPIKLCKGTVVKIKVVTHRGARDDFGNRLCSRYVTISPDEPIDFNFGNPWDNWNLGVRDNLSGISSDIYFAD